MIRLDNVLAVVSAAAFVVGMSASTLPDAVWVALVTATLILNVIANVFQARRGVSLRRSIVISAGVAGAASFLLVSAFAAAYFIGTDDGYITAHMFAREIPWWLMAGFIVAFGAVVFGFAAVIGHFVNLKFSMGDRVYE